MLVLLLRLKHHAHVSLVCVNLRPRGGVLLLLLLAHPQVRGAVVLPITPAKVLLHGLGRLVVV